MLKKFAVMGDPIAHSRSPEIHQAFAQQFDLQIDYQRIQVKAGHLREALIAFYEQGGCGASITLPLKEEAFQLCQERTERAMAAKAVNTIHLLSRDHYRGDNTDGVGLVTDLTNNHHCQVSDKKILIIGAGGAVRGILPALINLAPSRIVIANRTIAKAQQLANEFTQTVKITALALHDLNEPYDLIINGTSAGNLGQKLELSPKILAAQTICYDLAYGKAAEMFVSWCKQHGVQNAMDGLGMLVEQAAEAFYSWNHHRPATQIVMNELRAKIRY